MAVDPWAEAGSQPGGVGGYLSDADFRRTMDQTFGPGKWRETGGFRSQQREAALRAQGALTVAPGRTSAHTVGESDAPGAHDIVADGLTPEQTAAKIKAHAPDLFKQIYPEGAHGTQGAHLHLGVAPGTEGGDPWAEGTADPWAETKAPAAPKPESFLEKTERVGASLVGGAVTGGGKLVKDFSQLADVAEQRFGMIPPGAKLSDVKPVAQITAPVSKALTEGGDEIAPTNRSGLESFAHGAGEMVPALGAAVVDPALGAVAFGAGGYGQSHDEALAKGASEETAQTAGLENAGVQGALGMVPIGKIAEPLHAGLEGLTALGARLGLNVTGDAALGAAMQTGSNIVAKQTYDPGRPWYDQVPQSAAMMAGGGLLIHGAHEVIGGAKGLLRKPEAPVPEPGSPPVPAADMPATNAIRAYAGKGPVEAEAVDGAAPEAQTAARALNTAPVADGDAVLFNTDHGPAHGVVEESAPSVDGSPGDLVVKTPVGRARVPRDQAVPLPGDYEAARISTGAPLEQMPQAIADAQELRTAAPKGYSLFNAIRDLGGIKTREADGAPNDVAAIIDKAKPQPGVINNKSGLSPDGMREALKERGWFGAVDETGATARDSVAAPGTYLDDLHELIRKEVSGKDNRVYHPEAREQETRRADLEDQMQQAGVGLETPLPEAAAKLAAWRGQQVKTQTSEMQFLRQRAGDLGVKVREDASYDETLADVLEREAIQGEASPADADHYENLIDAELTPEEHEWLASGARGPVGEPVAAEPVAGPGESLEAAPQGGGGEPGPSAGGGGEDQAKSHEEVLASLRNNARQVGDARRMAVDRFGIKKNKHAPSLWTAEQRDFYKRQLAEIRRAEAKGNVPENIAANDFRKAEMERAAAAPTEAEEKLETGAVHEIKMEPKGRAEATMRLHTGSDGRFRAGVEVRTSTYGGGHLPREEHHPGFETSQEALDNAADHERDHIDRELERGSTDTTDTKSYKAIRKWLDEEFPTEPGRERIRRIAHLEHRAAEYDRLAADHRRQSPQTAPHDLDHQGIADSFEKIAETERAEAKKLRDEVTTPKPLHDVDITDRDTGQSPEVKAAYDAMQAAGPELRAGKITGPEYEEIVRTWQAAEKGQPPPVERQDIGGETVQQQLLAGGERSAKQAAAAREGALKPRVAQREAGDLFAPPEPHAPDLFGERDPWTETKAPTGGDLFAPKDIAATPEARETQAAKETPPGSGYGEKNKLFTKEAADEARAKLNALMRSQLNSGIDPEMVHAGIMLAGYHVEAGARKFGDFAHAMIRDLGEWSAPYLRMWYNALRDYPGFDAEGMTPHDKLSAAAIDEALEHVRRDGQDLEPGGEGAAAPNPDGPGPLPPGSAGAERGPGSEGAGAAEAGDRGEGGDGLPVGGTAPVGEGRPGGLFEDPSWNAGQPPQPGEPGGGDIPRDEGIQPDRIPAADLERVADEAAHLEPVAAGADPYAESTNAPPVSHELEEALPTLFPEQRSDVAFAEERFATADGHGVMFTNGTGTGKTYVAAGIAKRMFDKGKKDVLVVAPTQGIVNNHAEALGKLGVPFHILEGVDSHGPRDVVVVTTYANLANNRTLADRPWDAVIPDEAHTLSSDQAGSETAALRTFRAITNHPDRLRYKAELQLRKAVDKVSALKDRIPEGVLSGPAFDRWQEARHALDEKIAKKVAEFKAEDRSKAVFLSATPFAYDKSIDYAHGYLFDYGPEPNGRAYNQPSAQQAFMIRHFGYSMRTGKLTRPEAAVESDVMERQFHEWLRREGALSGRVLSVDKDYDRKFVTIDDAVGNKIDQALEFLNTADDGKFRPFAQVVQKRFNYLARARLLEAIKAKHVIPRIRQHQALGRKVVVFHNYNEGGGFNPFADLEHVHFIDEEPGFSKALHAEFMARNPYVADLEAGIAGLASPLAQLKEAFPDALIYNGNIPKAERERAKQAFNKDGGAHNLIIIQSEAGQAGISLHDTTGKHQRATENLGLPGRPVAAIQQEGRTYRIGQASDAIFRYLNTGTNWERHAFAHTIAQRAGTAENLALGDQSRTLRESFINAYLDSAPNPPARGEGTGGKKADFDLAKALTDFQKAKSFYFAEGKKRGRRDSREGTDYFATPEPLGLKMVEWADMRAGDKALEPSAGHGAIARFFPETTDRTLIEPSAHLASRAALSSPGAKVLEERFEELHAVNKYHGIVMNPPFGHGGATAVDHIAKAAGHLADGGRIVALIPRGGSADARFEKFMESPAAKGLYQVADVHLPAVTFERAGTKVNTRVVVLERQNTAGGRDAMQEMKTRDYTGAENIGELFDRLEHAEMPQRVVGAAGEAAEAPVETRQDPAKVAENTRALATGNRTFDTGETLHGKTGAPVYVATAKDRMATDEYKAVLALAKEHGGFYSYFRGKGAIPGFQFKSPQERAAFMEAATSTEGGKFSAPPIFYSAVEKHVADSPTKAAPADQWKAMLKNAPGIKQEELQWTGVGDWLDLFPKGEKVPKEKLQAFLRDNGVHVDEKLLGEPVDDEARQARNEAITDRADELHSAEIDTRVDEHMSYHPDSDEAVVRESLSDTVPYDDFLQKARDEHSMPQYEEWKLPGGTNYRELLLTLPKEASPPATHWDTPGVMAHVRFDERTSPDGKKVLFVEEVQSDWHQKGRDQGYSKPASAEELAAAEAAYDQSVTDVRNSWPTFLDAAEGLWEQVNPESPAPWTHDADAYRAVAVARSAMKPLLDLKPGARAKPEFVSARRAAAEALAAIDAAQLRTREALTAREIARGKGGIPEAPFKTTWPNLVMKRVIRWAVDNGFERVAWTTGEQQAERYDLTKHIGRVEFHDNAAGGIGRAKMEGPTTGGTLIVKDPTGRTIMDRTIGARGREDDMSELHELIGKELTEKLLAAEPTETTGGHGWKQRTRALEGLDVKIGGEGMKAFYDRNLVNITNDLIKKHGGKVDHQQLKSETGGDAQYVPVAELEAERAQHLANGNREAVRQYDEAIEYAKQVEAEWVQPGFDITPELAKHVAGGQPLFRRPGEGDVGRQPGQTERGVILPGTDRGLQIRKYDNPTAAQTALIDHVEQVVRKIAPFADVHAASSMEAHDGDVQGQVFGYANKAGLRHILAWSLEAPSGTAVARHEAVHVLKQAGLFHPEEWAALTRAAFDGDWLTQFNIEHRYRDLNISQQVEEAIADKFGEWQANGRRGLSGPVGDAFRKIGQVLARVRDLVRQFQGKNPDFKDVFSRMESGQVGSRFGEDIRDTTDLPAQFSVPGASKEPERVRGIFNRLLGRHTEAVGRKLSAAAAKAIPDPMLDIADQVKMGASPMGSGSTRAQAAAKDFANELRTSAYQWGKVDEWLNKTFSRDRQQEMWEAADEEGVLIRRGVAPGPGEGLNRLNDRERAAVLNLQERADAAFDEAKARDMVRGEGLESYVPRMVVEMTAGGPRIVSSASPRAVRKGANLSTTTGQLRQRKYETVEETEEAARKHFGEKAVVVRNIRTLALATQRLERAIAGRVLVDKIKAMSKDASAALVVSGGRPDSGAFFTLDHPALQQWRPKFIRDESTGKTVAAEDQNGETIFEAHPVWVAREFEGPLKAVLSTPSSGVVRALMDLKGKMMSVIMYSPLMHNAVIWGKAIPADPRGVLSLQAYRRGGAAKADPQVMEEAMRAGLDPIGRRFFNQDVTSIAEGAQIVPGRSWTSQVLAYFPGLLDPKAGEAVKAAVDKAGDVWHNTFLWDRVGDLQMGLYVHVRDQLLRKSNETGIGPRDAQRIAAHFANRYAGALPLESMSKLSRETANLLLFSRSFTLGNLAAYKDIVKGLPSDVRAQVLRDSGAEALERVQGAARQKAISMMVLDVGLSYVGLFMAAALTAWLTHQVMQPPWDNEEDRQKRFLIGYQPDGTAIYGRLPTGKVGEELQDWVTEPRDILLRKLSPYGKLMYGLAANDKGFGRKIYQPDDPLLKNAARVTWFAFQGMAPVGQIQGASDMVTGAQDRKTATLQALAPIAGITISKGAPGGPAMSDYYKARDRHDFAVQEAMPDIRRQIVRGDIAGARAKMQELGIAPGLQAYYVRVARNPGARLSRRSLRDFNAFATPEEKAQLQRDRIAAAARRVDETTP